ncbi:MAG: M48 family metallopeptidase [Gammaproteobacteria bacterium]|nr:M48 family metallopeptidase [Gammaproteobacteria bacterium]MCP5146392.1 M48 family metallopeptidase [Gammaproteobacteria bacterium]
MIKKLPALFLGLALPLATMGQNVIELPDIGDSAGSIISPQQERMLGSESMRQIRREAPVIDDTEVEDYIRSLGGKIADQADFYLPINFFMIKQNDINAFAVPGGYVGVNSGLLLNSRSESEVASVLAHEVVHLTQRHTVRSIEAQGRTAIPALIAMLGAIALAAASPEAGQAAIVGVQAAQQQYAINFTRGNEQEADRIGIQLLYDAGFDPMAMPEFFQKLQLANRYTDMTNVPEYLLTHPVTNNRIAEARDRAERLPRVQVESSKAYHLTWAKLKVLTADNPLQARQYYEAILRSGDYEDRDVALYGLALGQAAAANYDDARATLTDLIRRNPDQIAYRLAAADLEMRAGNVLYATDLYRIAYELAPDSRAALYGVATTLTLTDHAEEAREIMREKGFRDEDDPRYFRVLADAEVRAGREADGRFSMAEYYYRIGEYQLAMRQLDLAQQANGLTNYQTQRIRARMMEINDELARFRKERDRERRN